MKMKTTVSHKLFIVATMISFMCLTINAQNRANSHHQMKTRADEHAKVTTDEMKNKLNLNDSQYQKVYDINLKYAKKNKELAANSANEKSKEKTMKSQNEEKRNELKKVLTSEQYKKYDGMEKGMKKEAKKKGKGTKERTAKTN